MSCSGDKAPSELEDREALLAEIARRVEYVVTTTEISDEEKVAIARSVLNLIEHGEREVVR